MPSHHLLSWIDSLDLDLPDPLEGELPWTVRGPKNTHTAADTRARGVQRGSNKTALSPIHREAGIKTNKLAPMVGATPAGPKGPQRTQPAR